MRFMLMQLFGWSPTTFHSVWNAGNCQMYVLKKDMTKPGPSPYVLDKERGDVPRSSINVQVQVKQQQQQQQSGGSSETNTIVTKCLTLENYLNVPPPRTTQFNCIQHMLAEQYPDEIQNADDIVSIKFMPFVVVQTSSASSYAAGVVECKASLTSNTAAASSSATSLLDSSTSTPANGNVSSSSFAHDTTSEEHELSSSSSSSNNVVQWAKREQSLRWSYFRVPGGDKKSPKSA
jgi:hypothetical protein